MTHEPLSAANVSRDTAVDRERGKVVQPGQAYLERIRGSEEQNVTFLRHLARNTQAAYYLSETAEGRAAVHDAFRANISHFSVKSQEDQQELFFTLLAEVDEEAQQEAMRIRETIAPTAELAPAGSYLEVLTPVDRSAEPMTSVLAVTPEDNLEATYRAPATEFDTPISISLGEILQHPYIVAREFGKQALVKAGIIRSIE